MSLLGTTKLATIADALSAQRVLRDRLAELEFRLSRLESFHSQAAGGEVADRKSAAVSVGNTIWTAAEKKQRFLATQAKQAEAIAAGPVYLPEPNDVRLDDALMKQIREMIEAKYINVQRHDKGFPLVPYLTRSAALVRTCQFDKKWNAATIACRGLILDSNHCVVARPFGKFFNFGEPQPIPTPTHESFVAYDKLDGSLGVMYWYGGKPYIATRGSFQSEQSQVATDMLYKQYANAWPKLSKVGKTYLFEIIYPENRIVVDYGSEKKLCMIGVIDIKTGKDLPLEPEAGFPVVKAFDGLKDFKQIQTVQEKNREGFVVRFASGVRVKLKFEEYKKLHHAKSSVSSTTIWQVLSVGGDMNTILELLPDEQFNWVRKVEAELKGAFDALKTKCAAELKAVDDLKLSDRKTAAGHVIKHYPDHAKLIFAWMDARVKPEKMVFVNQMMWKMVEPEHSAPAGVERDPNAD